MRYLLRCSSLFRCYVWVLDTYDMLIMTIHKFENLNMYWEKERLSLVRYPHVYAMLRIFSLTSLHITLMSTRKILIAFPDPLSIVDVEIHVFAHTHFDIGSRHGIRKIWKDPQLSFKIWMKGNIVTCSVIYDDYDVISLQKHMGKNELDLNMRFPMEDSLNENQISAGDFTILVRKIILQGDTVLDVSFE